VRGIVVAGEAALDDLAEGDEREDLARRTGRIGEGDVGEEGDVDHVAREDLDGLAVAGEKGEGDAAGGQVGEEDRGVTGHGVLPFGAVAGETRNDRRALSSGGRRDARSVRLRRSATTCGSRTWGEPTTGGFGGILGVSFRAERSPAA